MLEMKGTKGNFRFEREEKLCERMQRNRARG